MSRIRLIAVVVIVLGLVVGICSTTFAYRKRYGALICECYKTKCGTFWDVLNPIPTGPSRPCVRCVCVRDPDRIWGGEWFTR